MQAKKVNIFIDGAARGNPGEAGIGIIIKDAQGREVKKMYKYIGQATNNVAEYAALVYALQQALIINLRDIVVHSDSELLVRQLKGEYRVKNSNLRPYYEQFLHLKAGFQRLELKQISRSNNKETDRLANLAVDSRIDTGLKTI